MRQGFFVTTLWRDWLTADVLDRFQLNDRQKQAVQYLKIHARINNSDYQGATGASRATASRELEALLSKGVLEKVGTTGKGTHYVLARKRIAKASKES